MNPKRVDTWNAFCTRHGLYDQVSEDSYGRYWDWSRSDFKYALQVMDPHDPRYSAFQVGRRFAPLVNYSRSFGVKGFLIYWLALFLTVQPVVLFLSVGLTHGAYWYAIFPVIVAIYWSIYWTRKRRAMKT